MVAVHVPQQAAREDYVLMVIGDRYSSHAFILLVCRDLMGTVVVLYFAPTVYVMEAKPVPHVLQIADPVHFAVMEHVVEAKP